MQLVHGGISGVLWYYTAMLFNTDPSTIQMTASHLNGEGSLLHTTVQNHGRRFESFEPVDYFIMPDNAPTYGRVVIGLVSLDRKGFPVPDVPRVYAVANRLIGDESDLAANERAQATAREYHVLAEDLAMRRGVLKPAARSTSEIFVADRLPYSHRSQYLETRVAHLEATRRVVLEATEPEGPKRKVVTELSIAVEALKDRLAQLRA